MRLFNGLSVGEEVDVRLQLLSCSEAIHLRVTGIPLAHRCMPYVHFFAYVKIDL